MPQLFQVGRMGRLGRRDQLGDAGAEGPTIDTTAFFYADLTRNTALYNGTVYEGLADVPGYSFTRATVGYALDQQGVLRSFSSGQLRLTDRGLLVEGAATNLCLYSGDQTNAAYTATNMTVAMSATGPDNAANSAALLTATAGNATLTQAFTIASAVKTFSVWLKRVTGTGNIDMTLDNGSTWTTKTLTTSWQRFDITQTLANPTLGLRIVASGDAIQAAFFQMEATAYATSYIPTTTASATRNADVISVGSVSNLAYPVTLFAEFAFADSDSSVSANSRAAFGVGTSGTTAERNGIYNLSGGVGGLSQTGGATQASPGVVGTVAVGSVIKTAYRVQQDNFNFAKNGTLGTTDVSGSASATPNIITIGSWPGSVGYLNGYLRRLAILPTGEADALLQARTA